MNPMQQMVKDFHKKYTNISRDKPEMPSPEMLLLRARLIAEEYGEFINAATHKDMVKMIDALCDILYVTFGTADVMGVDLEPHYDEVQRSNMSKRGVDKSGKIQKGDDYFEPDLESILRRQGYELPELG